MLKTKNNRLLSLLGFLISLAIFLISLWVITNKQYIIDEYNVLQYKPTADVQSIADKTTFTDNGKFYLYASNPSVETAADFNNDCKRLESNNAILGCYTNKRIYVYNVENKQLDGIQEVTAAHETLHAIWDRMSEKDKASVGVMLDEAYSKINDPDLSSRMDYYARNEPGERLNELHSILGTEYPDLGNNLENYYKKYFTDRSKIVAFHKSYQSVFDNLKSQSDSLFSDLQSKKASIDASIAKYNNDISVLQADYNALQASLASVDRTSAYQVNQYNSKVQSLRSRADALDVERTQILAAQDMYNKEVAQYNQLVVASNDLVKSIDSTLQSSPSI
jgi:hypothetical protein